MWLQRFAAPTRLSQAQATRGCPRIYFYPLYQFRVLLILLQLPHYNIHGTFSFSVIFSKTQFFALAKTGLIDQRKHIPLNIKIKETCLFILYDHRMYSHDTWYTNNPESKQQQKTIVTCIALRKAHKVVSVEPSSEHKNRSKRYLT